MKRQSFPEGAPLIADDGISDRKGAGIWSASHLETLVNQRLRALMPSEQEAPKLLHKAMSYSVLAPGKRCRPIITLLTSHHFGCRHLLALDCACAVEIVHAASLIMDDLPAMDNAEQRRGQPTLHRAFGEDIAMLSSVALLNMAFGVVAAIDSLPPSVRIELVRLLSSAIGSDGLAGGQVMDLRLRDANVGKKDLDWLNQRKTSQLFVAAAEAGALIAGAPTRMLESVRRFALELGFAFQIADDVLDGLEYLGQTGKDTGKDKGKPTLVSILGNVGAKKLYHAHVNRCREALSDIGATNCPLGVFVERCLAHTRI
jgi:geranylgeranyl diphosphate synthase type II